MWEALAVLVAVRIWGKLFADGRARFQLRGDSVASLTLAGKLASSAPKLNAIGAEIALELEVLNIAEVFTAHTPGKLLILADYLSRLHMPGVVDSMPLELSTAKRRVAPVRDGKFYRVWSIAC